MGDICSPIYPSIMQILSEESFNAEFRYKDVANRVNFVAGEKTPFLIPNLAQPCLFYPKLNFVLPPAKKLHPVATFANTNSTDVMLQ